MLDKLAQQIEDWLGNPFKIHAAINRDELVSQECEGILRLTSSNPGIMNNVYYVQDSFQIEFLLPIETNLNTKLVNQIRSFVAMYNANEFNLSGEQFAFKITFSDIMQGNKIDGANGEQYQAAMIFGTLVYTDVLDSAINTTVKLALTQSVPSECLRGMFQINAHVSSNCVTKCDNNALITAKPGGYSFQIDLNGWVVKADSQYQILKNWFFDVDNARRTNIYVAYSDGVDTITKQMIIADMDLMSMSNDYSKVQVKLLEV